MNDNNGAPAPALAPAGGEAPGGVDIASAVDDIGDALLDSLGVDEKDRQPEGGEGAEGGEGGEGGDPAAPEGETPEAKAAREASEKAAADAAKKGAPAAAAPATPAAPAKPDIDPATGKPKIPATLPNGLPQEFRTWRPEAQALLLKAQANPELKPLVDEALKREQDMDKGIAQYREAATYADAFRKVVAPFMPLMQHHQIDPLKEIGQLLNFRAVLALGTPEQKVGLLRTIAKQAGVSYESLGAEEPAVAPEVAALREELSTVKSTTTQQLEALRAERTEVLRKELEAFASDPANRYFDEVAGDIPRLIKSGLAKGYKDAYEMAVKLNPVVSAKEQQRLKDEAAAEAKKQADADAAARNKAKGANVTSSAKNRSAAAPVGSIEDTLRETFREINSRS